MSVEYSREQAEQVIKDYNIYDGYSQLNEDYIDFLNHKFPPKIEYVGEVWKIDNQIFLCTKQKENGSLLGYGISENDTWFLREDEDSSLTCCTNFFLKDLTKATPTEWMEALEKYAESKYNVGDEVKCLSDKQLEIIASFNHATNKFNCQNEWWATAESGVALLMEDGIWAEIITPAKDELNEKLEELTKLARSQGKSIDITFKN